MPSGVHSQSAERSLYAIFFSLAVGAAGMAALLALLPPAGHDQLWFLIMAHRWLAGAELYGSQAFDSNPPGIVWLSALPVLLARWLHLPVTFAAKTLVVLAESTTSVVSLIFLRRLRPVARYEIPAMLFAAFVLFYAVAARDFGQRDQMLAFLVLPYVLAAGVDPRRDRLMVLRVVAGIMAAMGICLKPHHAVIVLAVELALLLSPALAEHALWLARMRRLLRPEPLLIVFLGAGFLAAVHHFAPLYLARALPVVRDTYWAIGHLSPAALAGQAIQLCVLAAVTAFFFVRVRPRSPAIALLLLAGVAAAFAYVVQGTGWYYQQIPAITFFGIALVLLLLDILKDRLDTPSFAVPVWLVPAAAGLCLVAVALTAHFTGYPFTRERAFAPVFADEVLPSPALFSGLAAGTPVATLTTSVEAAMMPVERYRLAWAQRTNNLWLLPAILRTEAPGAQPDAHHILSPARVAELDALQHRWMVEDLTRWRPEMILVERCQDAAVSCQELEDRHDNLLAWFLRDPAFGAIWSNYTYAGTSGRFNVYRRSR